MAKTKHQTAAHHLVKKATGWVCEICGREWVSAKEPRSVCAGVRLYGTWKAVEAAGLLTKKQMSTARISCGEVRGAIVYGGHPAGFVWLFDPKEGKVKPPLSDKQIAAMEKLRAGALKARTCTECGKVEGQKRDLWYGGICERCYHRRKRADAVEDAREWLNADMVVIDTETTGLDAAAEIVSITIIDKRGRLLVDTLIKPEKPIDETGIAYQVNGISNAAVEDAPRFVEVLPMIRAAIAGRVVIAYNVEFDRERLRSVCKRAGCEMPRADWNCAMLAFAAYFGDYNYKYDDYRWQALETAIEFFGMRGGDAHTAHGDAAAALAVVKAMAGIPVPA